MARMKAKKRRKQDSSFRGNPQGNSTRTFPATLREGFPSSLCAPRKEMATEWLQSIVKVRFLWRFTKLNNSITSSLAIRMQPCEAGVPRSCSWFVPWM